HAVVLETARRIQPLILQEQTARPDADVAGDRVGFLENGLAFPDGQHLLRRRERKQLAEAPYAAEIQWVAAIGPLGLKVLQRARRRQALPVVSDVKQAAAARTRKRGFVHAAGGAAGRVDTTLKDGFTHDVSSLAWRTTSRTGPGARRCTET